MQQIEHAPDRGDPGPLLVQVSYIHVTNFCFFRICYMKSCDQHGCIADSGVVVIVGGQKFSKCPPEGVCSRINTFSLTSPQMAVFWQDFTFRSSFCTSCRCRRGRDRYGMVCLTLPFAVEQILVVP